MFDRRRSILNIPEADYWTIGTYIIYCLKIFLICLVILIIGALIESFVRRDVLIMSK